MQYRIVENTYENAEVWYIIQVRKASNVDWVQEDLRKYDKEKDAEDVILAILEATKAKVIVSSVVLGTYE